MTLGEKLKLGDKGLHVYRMLTQHVARDNSGLSLARRNRCQLFLEMDHVGDTRGYHSSLLLKRDGR